MSPLPAAKQSASSAQHPNPTSQVSVDPIVPCPHPSSSSGSVAETSSASVPVIEAARTSPTPSPNVQSSGKTIPAVPEGSHPLFSQEACNASPGPSASVYRYNMPPFTLDSFGFFQPQVKAQVPIPAHSVSRSRSGASFSVPPRLRLKPVSPQRPQLRISTPRNSKAPSGTTAASCAHLLGVTSHSPVERKAPSSSTHREFVPAPVTLSRHPTSEPVATTPPPPPPILAAESLSPVDPTMQTASATKGKKSKQSGKGDEKKPANYFLEYRSWLMRHMTPADQEEFEELVRLDQQNVRERKGSKGGKTSGPNIGNSTIGAYSRLASRRWKALSDQEKAQWKARTAENQREMKTEADGITAAKRGREAHESEDERPSRRRIRQRPSQHSPAASTSIQTLPESGAAAAFPSCCPRCGYSLPIPDSHLSLSPSTILQGGAGIGSDTPWTLPPLSQVVQTDCSSQNSPGQDRTASLTQPMTSMDAWASSSRNESFALNSDKQISTGVFDFSELNWDDRFTLLPALDSDSQWGRLSSDSTYEKGSFFANASQVQSRKGDPLLPFPTPQSEVIRHQTEPQASGSTLPEIGPTLESANRQERSELAAYPEEDFNNYLSVFGPSPLASNNEAFSWNSSITGWGMGIW